MTRRGMSRRAKAHLVGQGERIGGLGVSQHMGGEAFPGGPRRTWGEPLIITRVLPPDDELGERCER